MMPLVTVLDSVPSGLPTATTVSPTASALLSPMTAGVRPVASTLMTATSEVVSCPTMAAS